MGLVRPFQGRAVFHTLDRRVLPDAIEFLPFREKRLII